MKLSLRMRVQKKMSWQVLGLVAFSLCGLSIVQFENAALLQTSVTQPSVFEEVEIPVVVEPEETLEPVMEEIDIPEPVEIVPEKPAPKPKIQTPEVIHPYPPELTVQGFANMKLEGNNLQIISVMNETDAYTEYRITYDSNGVTISGVLLVPKGSGPFPTLILNHGYFPEEEYTLGRGLKREQRFFAEAGYVVLHTDYRGHAFSDPNPDTRLLYDSSLGYAMDSVNAVNALKDLNWSQIDTSRVGVLGHSMGGEIALDIAVAHPDVFDALVLYAPANGNAWQNFDRWKREELYTQNTLDTYGTYVDNPERWDQLSSQTYLNRIEVPVAVFQGDADDIVPSSWSDTLVKDLEAAGKEVWYTIYPEEDHEFEERFWDYIVSARAFLDRKVK